MCRGLPQVPLVDGLVRVLVEPPRPRVVDRAVLLRQGGEETVDHVVGRRVDVLYEDVPLLVLVVLLEQSLEVARVAHAAQSGAPLVEGELSVVVRVQAEAPCAHHGPEVAPAQRLELLDGIYDEVLRVESTRPGELVLLGLVPCPANVPVEARLLALVEAHLQRAAAVSVGSIRLAEHPEIRTGEGLVRLGIEVLERQKTTGRVRLHHTEQLLGLPLESNLLAGIDKGLLVDAARAHRVHPPGPRQEHVPVLVLQLALQIGQLSVRVRIQVGEQDVVPVAGLQLVPEALDLAEEGQALKGLAELAKGEAAVAVEVEGLPPGAQERPAPVGERSLEALGRVEARPHPGDVVVGLPLRGLLRVHDLLPEPAQSSGPGLPVALLLRLRLLRRVVVEVLEELHSGLGQQAVDVAGDVAMPGLRVEVLQREAKALAPADEHPKQLLTVQVQLQALYRIDDLLLLDAAVAADINALLPALQHVAVLSIQRALERPDVVSSCIVDLHQRHRSAAIRIKFLPKLLQVAVVTQHA
mmetsp:Transcript_21959/g.57304  ORF Transcript_21959/g.57304 Transcript_21959/m.57304 type:complete len:526 (+) Transcript_21959:798-2375(+)